MSDRIRKCSRDLNLAWDTVGFRMTGGIHSFPPQIAQKATLPDYSRNRRAGIDSDADL